MTERFIDIKVRTGNSKQEIKSLDNEVKKLSADTDKAAQSNKNLATSNTQLTKTAQGVKSSISGIGRGAGQAGIQVQQFVGQIQGGQSAMLALSQQSADLGFVLGAPLVGAIVGVTASVVGMALEFNKAGKDVEEFSFDVEEATEKLEDLSKAQVSVAIRATEKRLEELSKQAEEAGNSVAALNQKLDKSTRTNTEFTKTGRVVISEIKRTAEETEELTKKQEVARSTLDSINQEYKKTSDLLVKLSQNKSGYKQATIDAAEEEKKEAQELVNSSKIREQILTNRLSQETELLRAELGIRQAVNDGFMTQQEANATASFVKSGIRRAAAFEAEIAQLSIDEESKEVLREQFRQTQLAAEQNFEQQKTNIALSESNKRIAQAEKEAREQQRLNSNLLGAAINLSTGLIKNALESNAKTEKEQKRARKVGVVIDTAAGIARAFAENPYPVALGISALVAANGLVQLSAINSAGSITPPSGGVPSAQQQTTPADAPTQTRAIDLRTDGSAFGLAVAEGVRSALSGDDDIIVSITEAQLEYARIGGGQ